MLLAAPVLMQQPSSSINSNNSGTVVQLWLLESDGSSGRSSTNRAECTKHQQGIGW
jgi:hypothetical protein